jgi:hypothetical protein
MHIGRPILMVDDGFLVQTACCRSEIALNTECIFATLAKLELTIIGKVEANVDLQGKRCT